MTRLRTPACCAVLLGALLPTGCSSLPQESRAAFRSGIAAREAGRTEEAIERFTRAIESAGNASHFYTAAILERGDCRLKLCRQSPATTRNDYLARALNDFQAVSTLQRPTVLEKARALHGQGQVSLLRGDAAIARKFFEDVLALRPESADETSGALARFHLPARRELGLIELDEALVRLSRSQGVGSGTADERLRTAQEHFFRGLEIAPRDPVCNLGIGICLHLRGQSGVAIPHLKRSLQQPDAPGIEPVGEQDPRPWFYLARSLEEDSGYQKKAIDHYARALERDTDRDFLPLYLHLASELPVYLPFSERPAEDWLADLIEYRGKETAYWEQIAELAERFLEETEAGGELESLAHFALGLSAARRGKTREAVRDVVAIAGHPRFERWFDRVFPDGEELDSLEALGRARVLFELGQHEELEAWFADGRSRQLEERLTADAAARDALILRGQNLLELWRVHGPSEDSLESDGSPAGDEKTPREPSPLIVARRIFEECLAVKEDPRARRGLARTLEHLGSYGEALVHYEFQAEAEPEDPEVFRHVRELHESDLLTEEEKHRAWTLLQEYSGDDEALLGYVDSIRQSLERRAPYYCRGCGRQNPGSAERCLECGRRLPDAPPAPAENARS